MRDYQFNDFVKDIIKIWLPGIVIYSFLRMA